MSSILFQCLVLLMGKKSHDMCHLCNRHGRHKFGLSQTTTQAILLGESQAKKRTPVFCVFKVRHFSQKENLLLKSCFHNSFQTDVNQNETNSTLQKVSLRYHESNEKQNISSKSWTAHVRCKSYMGKSKLT